jgi:hypothetical protein
VPTLVFPLKVKCHFPADLPRLSPVIPSSGLDLSTFYRGALFHNALTPTLSKRDRAARPAACAAAAEATKAERKNDQEHWPKPRLADKKVKDGVTLKKLFIFDCSLCMPQVNLSMSIVVSRR